MYFLEKNYRESLSILKKACAITEYFLEKKLDIEEEKRCYHFLFELFDAVHNVPLFTLYYQFYLKSKKNVSRIYGFHHLLDRFEKKYNIQMKKLPPVSPYSLFLLKWFYPVISKKKKTKQRLEFCTFFSFLCVEARWFISSALMGECEKRDILTHCSFMMEVIDFLEKKGSYEKFTCLLKDWKKRSPQHIHLCWVGGYEDIFLRSQDMIAKNQTK
jgi:hypothetical protein